MIKISKMADYATVIMAYLAKINHQGTAREIAAATHIAWPTVCKILKILVKKELLASTRGANGGYELARPALDISLAHILRAMSEDVAMTECASSHGQCVVQPFCNVSHHWQSISSVVTQALQALSLADLIATPPASAVAIRSAKPQGKMDPNVQQSTRSVR